MFKSIFTTALRNIIRNRSFSLINLIGLSVSMSLGLLIILIIQEQYTYDRFHDDVDRIYRVNTRALRTSGGIEPYASAPLPIARVLSEEYSFTEKVVRINSQLNADAIYGNTHVPVSGLFVDPSFLEVFNFPLEKGNPATVLSEPNSLLLSAETAIKIFGSQEPMGQSITLSGYGDFIITGVLKKTDHKTHLDFEMLASSTALASFEKQGIVFPSLDDWNNYYGGYVYFKLKKGKSTKEVEAALAAMTKKYYSSLKLETRDRGYEFYLHPLTEITPGPELSNQMGQGLPDFFLLFLGALAGIVMVMSGFNFTNLTIAKSLSRSREIGIRKIVGAQRFQVFFQFVTESVIFSLIALIFSYLLMQFLKTGFLQLPLNQEFAMDLRESPTVYIYFILFAITVGIFAGLLPAIYLSAFKPIKVLKYAGNLKVYTGLTFRKILMIAQFTVSVIFLVVVIVIYRQVDYMLSADYGFNQKNIINVRLQGLEFEKLATQMRSLNGVMNVGAVSHALGTWQDRASDYKRNRGDEPFVMHDFAVDENYIQNLELKFISGRNFEASSGGAQEKHVILNEKALVSFGFADPISAIGQTVYVNDSVMLQVIGVVRDFHYRPLNTEIGPLALRYYPNNFSYLSAKIDPQQQASVAAAVESIWKKLDPIHPVSWKMMEDEIDEAYRDAGMHDVLIIVGYITFLAIVLACLGMLGMSMYAAQTRVKEIGIRKVMGASISDIIKLLSKSFLILIGISAIIALPFSYLLGDIFLNLYAYKIEITPWLLLSGVGIIVTLGAAIIGTQTISVAAADPVESLRYE